MLSSAPRSARPDAGCRVSEMVVDGDRCLALENAEMRTAVDVDHGAHMYELIDLRSGTNLLHQDPLGPRLYRVGGWFELFPNAGAACSFNGHRLSRAGDIQRRAWAHRALIARADRVAVELRAESAELPLRLTKTLTLSSTTSDVLVAETVTNLSESPQQFLWGQHITFGRAVMTASSRIDLPAVEFHTGGLRPAGAPYAHNARGRLSALPTGTGETVDLTLFPAEPFTAMLFSDPLPEHWYNVWADDLDFGLAVAWDASIYAALWLWATRNGHPADPDAIACAIEPQASAVPSLDAAAAAGTALSIGPRASTTSWVRATLHHDSARVTGVGSDGALLRAAVPERTVPPT